MNNEQKLDEAKKKNKKCKKGGLKLALNAGGEPVEIAENKIRSFADFLETKGWKKNS